MFKSKYIVPLVFVYALLAPQNVLNYSLQAAFPVLLIAINQRKARGNLFALLLAITIFISYLVTFNTYNIENKAIFRMTALVSMLVLFPFTQYEKLPTTLLLGAFAIVLVSQLSYAFDIKVLKEYIDILYPADEISKYKTDLVQPITNFNDFGALRYGGIFKNPNNCGRFLTLLFAVFLIEFNKENKLYYLYVFLFFISVILTGSRTALGVFGLLYLYWTFRNIGKTKKEYRDLALSITFLLFIFVFLTFIQSRSFKIETAFEDSYAYKSNVFLEYYDLITTNNDVSAILFGKFALELSAPMVGSMDSEFGNAFFSFGLIGSMLLIFFYWNLFFEGDKRVRLLLIVVIWSISNTVLFSYQMSFLFLFALSNYYSASREDRRLLMKEPKLLTQNT